MESRRRGTQIAFVEVRASVDSPLAWLELPGLTTGNNRMARDVFRVVTRGTDGKLRIKDYNRQDSLLRLHTQVGIDDCSTDLGLRGLPVFRGLIGPMPEGSNIIRYESPEVFETLTKEWSATRLPRRARPRAPSQEQTV